MATIIGLDCELRHNSGTYASPTWAKCDAVKDANLEVTVNEVDASRRGSGGWRQNETTLKEATLNVTFVKDSDDTTFTAIQTAYQANNAMELAVLDGADGSGTEWLTAKWKVTQWNETQGLEDVVNIEAVFRIAPDADLVPTYGSDALPTTRS